MQRNHLLIGAVAVLCVLGGVIATNQPGRNTPPQAGNAPQGVEPQEVERQEVGAQGVGAQGVEGSLAPMPTATAMRIKAATPDATKIVVGAKKQIGILYDPAYVKIDYPRGDISRNKGVCSDVVVRALRGADHDLQRLVHEDMKSHFALYPKNWGLKKPDPNIDHRRVPNLMRFFERHGRVLTKEVTAATARQWQPGDIVCWRLPNNLYHTGVISDRLDEHGIPFVIHNLSVCREEDCLRAWKIIGHYRYPVPAHG